MRCFLLISIVLFGLTGCEWAKNLVAGKAENPVFDEPPPRVKIAERRTPLDQPNDGFPVGSGLQQTSGTDTTADPATDLTGSQWIAKIDGTPILASEILERYAMRFEKIRRDTGGNEQILRTARERAIQRDLPEHIRRRLLVNAFRKSLPQENLDKLDEYINTVFEERIEQIKKDLKVNSRFEVEQALQQQGTSIATLRDSFANQQMARQFLDAKKQTKKVFGRPEMMHYYNEHIADYRKPARVHWQEIEIQHFKHGGKQNAMTAFQQVVDALQAGQDFSSVAKKYSDGSNAANGGVEDWTLRGTLADKQLERALFELPVGSISSPISDETTFRIARIIERDDERFTPFGDVQQEIKKTLEAQVLEENEQKVIEELYANAVITTIFDRRKAAAVATAPKPIAAPVTRTAGNPFATPAKPVAPNPFAGQ